MSALARFQDDFRNALYGDRSGFAPGEHPSFAIYRNTSMRGCLDALEANYPAVVCLVGREWFRAAAAVHVAGSPPRDARLVTYGDDFPAFIAAFPPASELPYLADVARLDRLWTESFVAADAVVFTAADAASLDPDVLGALSLQLHPAARLFASSLPAVSIWKASRVGSTVDDDLVWQAEFAIVSRVDNEVGVVPIEASAWCLVESIVEGASLAEAALMTLGKHADARIDLILASLLQAGAFTA